MATKNIQVTAQVGFNNDWVQLHLPLDIRDLKSVKIKFNSNTPSDTYIDRIEVNNKSWKTEKLMLEYVEHVLTNNYVLGSAEFGEKFETLVDSISDKVEAGDTMLDLAARQ